MSCQNNPTNQFYIYKVFNFYPIRRSQNIQVLLVLVLLSMTSPLWGQNSMPQDSSLFYIDKEEDPKQKVVLEIEYVRALARVSIDSAENYVDQLLDRYRVSKDSFGLARVKSIMAYVLVFDNRY